ncbi:MAG: Dabb family protein [Chloroflexi bacterium]|nr:Dabb family protein [Chloroflexota bacterium]
MFFHILLWSLYPDARPEDVAEGMRRMRRENPQEMKRLTFGRRLDIDAPEPGSSGEFTRPAGSDGPLERTGEPFDYFFVMDFEDAPAYRRYVTSPSHDDPAATHPEPGFAWESCAARWSEFLSSDHHHEEGSAWRPASVRGPGSLLHMVLWDVREDATELRVDEMFAALEQLPEAIPEVLSFSFGRSFRPTWGGRSVVDRSLLVPRGTGPLPYRRVGDQPRFGLLAEFADLDGLRTYLAHPAHTAFVTQHVGPLWTRLLRHEMEIEEG